MLACAIVIRDLAAAESGTAPNDGGRECLFSNIPPILREGDGLPVRWTSDAGVKVMDMVLDMPALVRPIVEDDNDDALPDGVSEQMIDRYLTSAATYCLLTTPHTR